MTDLNEIKSILESLLTKTTQLGVMVQNVEKQTSKQTEIMKSFTDQTEKNFTVVRASLDNLEKETTLSNSRVRKILKNITDLQVALKETHDWVGVIHDGWIEEANIRGRIDRQISERVAAVETKSAEAGD